MLNFWFTRLVAHEVKVRVQFLGSRLRKDIDLRVLVVSEHNDNDVCGSVPLNFDVIRLKDANCVLVLS